MKNLTRQQLSEVPAETSADDPHAVTDADWFGSHPKRRYRARSGWVVRRVAGVYLRVANPGATGDADEAAAEAIWWSSAWPELDSKTRNAMVREARRRAR